MSQLQRPDSDVNTGYLAGLLVDLGYWSMPTMHPDAVMSRDQYDLEFPVWGKVTGYAISTLISWSFYDRTCGEWVEPQKNGVVHALIPLAYQALGLIVKAHICDYGRHTLEIGRVSIL